MADMGFMKNVEEVKKMTSFEIGRMQAKCRKITLRTVGELCKR